MKFYAELTDTFGGEANYSWVTRMCIVAKNARGAKQKIGRVTGLSFHETMSGEVCRMDSKSGATCYFLEAWDDETHAQHLRIETI